MIGPFKLCVKTGRRGYGRGGHRLTLDLLEVGETYKSWGAPGSEESGARLGQPSKQSEQGLVGSTGPDRNGTGGGGGLLTLQGTPWAGGHSQQRGPREQGKWNRPLKERAVGEGTGAVVLHEDGFEMALLLNLDLSYV